ncbi:MAG: hypothetical protein Q8O93_04915 [bacterium]|nr:hypothetical protein [bacterium]
MPTNNYFFKIIILSAATMSGLFAIWYALARQESVDWVVGQVGHQVSPYAVTDTGDGMIVTDVVRGYTFILPAGFKTSGARNLSFYLEDAGVKECEIRHYYNQSARFELIDGIKTSACVKYLDKIEKSLVIY